MLPIYENARLGRKVNSAPSKILQEPPKMYIQCSSPGDSQTSCKVWLASGERRRCGNEGKTQKPLKFAGVPQTRQQISAVNGPFKFAILCGHVEDVLLFNNLFGAQVAIFCTIFASCISASRVQHISDMHSKFVLRPHHLWKYGRHPISDR